MQDFLRECSIEFVGADTPRVLAPFHFAGVSSARCSSHRLICCASRQGHRPYKFYRRLLGIS